MNNGASGPVLVRAAEPANEGEQSSVNEPSHAIQKGSLSVSIPDEILTGISTNTVKLREKLNKFVNGMDSKIQSVWPDILMQSDRVVDITHERFSSCSSDTISTYGR
jgi:hypothetical protein